MKNNFIEFEKQRKNIFEKLKMDYETKINKARNVVVVHNLFYNDIIRNQYPPLQDSLGKHTRFLIDVRDIYDQDNTREFGEIFDSKILEEKIENNHSLLSTLAEVDAMDMFLTYWRERNEHFVHPSNAETVKESKIKWKGTNETEFVQFIYSAWEAGYLQNEENQITKLVEQAASLLSFQLGKHWQTNFSRSVVGRNADYLPEIFKNLEHGFVHYRNRKITKQR